MSSYARTAQLSDEELQTVTAGNNNSTTIISSLSQLTVGDIVNVANYIVNGLHCYVKKNQYGAYKLVSYVQGGKYIDNAINISTIPNGVTLTLVGHDDQFVEDNL